jgi:hypothetical protein
MRELLDLPLVWIRIKNIPDSIEVLAFSTGWDNRPQYGLNFEIDSKLTPLTTTVEQSFPESRFETIGKRLEIRDLRERDGRGLEGCFRFFGRLEPAGLPGRIGRIGSRCPIFGRLAGTKLA